MGSRLNQQLQDCGEQPFCRSTLKEFARRMQCLEADSCSCTSVSSRSTPAEPSANDSCKQNRERLLWDVLWAARPLWTPLDLCAADKKLSGIGVNSLASLQTALSSADGINGKLRKTGAKVFTSETVRALKNYVPDDQQ